MLHSAWQPEVDLLETLMQKKSSNNVQRLIVFFYMVILCAPLIVVSTQAKLFDSFSVNENTKPVARPSQRVKGFFNREWQSFGEQFFLQKLGGLRSFLILSYNEAMHHLFRINPQKNYLRAAQFGYYPMDTIVRLNNDVIHYEAFRPHYQRAARRLHVLQNLFDHYGVKLLVVLAPSKVQVYPEYVASYLIAPPDIIRNKVLNYGDVLAENGVNVLNIQRIFSEKKLNSAWPFFTDTSFHWSFWASCLVTNEILHKAEALTGQPFFDIDCSHVSYEKAKWQDRDIAEILNLFSKETIIGKAPFPLISPKSTPKSSREYKIAIVGDSFSEHIIYTLTKALPLLSWKPNWLTFYSYFQSRQIVLLNGKSKLTSFDRERVLPELLKKELVILEVYDANVVRDANGINNMEYGATWFLLNKLLPELNDGAMNPRNFLTSGWEAIGNNEWRTTSKSANFVIRTNQSGETTQLLLDIENRSTKEKGPHALTFSIDGQPIHSINIHPGRQTLKLLVPNTMQSQLSDPLLTEITLSSNTQPLDLVLHHAQITGTGRKFANHQSPFYQEEPASQPINTIDLFSNESYENLDVEGLSAMESNGKENWCWGLGPETKIRFYVDPQLPDSARQLLLTFGFKNGMSPKQAVTVRLNGKDILYFPSQEINKQQQVDRRLKIVTQKGVNVLEFIYNDWNHRKQEFSNTGDPRQLAVAFMNLSLQGANNETLTKN